METPEELEELNELGHQLNALHNQSRPQEILITISERQSNTYGLVCQVGEGENKTLHKVYPLLPSDSKEDPDGYKRVTAIRDESNLLYIIYTKS